MRRVLGIIIVLAALAGGGWFTWNLLTPVSPAPATFVLLRPGYSTHRIAAELKSAGVIRSERVFLLWHYLHRGRSLKAGEYRFEKAADIREVHRRLARGDVYFHTVVIPEGFTMFEIAQAIEAAGLGPAEDFVKVAQSNAALVSDLDPKAKSLEGYLFPDTYEFTRMMSMEDMAAAMVKQFRLVAHQIGLTPAEFLESGSQGSAPPGASNAAGFDVHQVVTMASIVEKETAVPEERPLVAGVYYNRLDKHMALDADPSIIYAEMLDGSYQGALHHADMQFKSPYNTYRNAGLPPGPIANPGRSSLEAAMHPAPSDYLYFVADAQGHHKFAKTIQEHDKNVAAYRRAMRHQ